LLFLGPLLQAIAALTRLIAPQKERVPIVAKLGSVSGFTTSFISKVDATGRGLPLKVSSSCTAAVRLLRYEDQHQHAD
jgi:type IV secretory pathway protease TraF